MIDPIFFKWFFSVSSILIIVLFFGFIEYGNKNNKKIKDLEKRIDNLENKN